MQTHQQSDVRLLCGARENGTGEESKWLKIHDTSGAGAAMSYGELQALHSKGQEGTYLLRYRCERCEEGFQGPNVR